MLQGLKHSINFMFHSKKIEDIQIKAYVNQSLADQRLTWPHQINKKCCKSKKIITEKFLELKWTNNNNLNLSNNSNKILTTIFLIIAFQILRKRLERIYV